MDNQTHNPENDWIDNKLASLAPAKEWHPDGHRALAQFKNRREQVKVAASPRWIQLSMVAAVLVSIGLVVTLLPWHALWEGAKADRSLQSEPPKAATPEGATKPAPVAPQALAVPATVAIQQPAQPSPSPEPKSPFKVGPGVTPPQVIPPVPEPDYSDDARRAHVQGTVGLNVIVRADGTGKVESIYRSVGFGLDQKAVEAFEKWRFIPGTKDGKPVDVQ